MFIARRPVSAGAIALAAVLLPSPAAQAGFYTYSFTGEVTAVDNTGGFFAAPAVVGAAVSGSFTYTDTPNGGTSSFNPFFTSYLHFNSLLNSPPYTDLRLTVGGAAAVVDTRSSLANQIVGNDNPTDALFFPAGDSFRFADRLDDRGSLFDQAALADADLFQYMFGSVFLVDPTGAAFSSQALPAGGLPLAALTRRYGVIDIFDDDVETTGLLQFRIDTVTPVSPVPAPATAGLLAAGAGFAGLLARVRRFRPA